MQALPKPAHPDPSADGESTRLLLLPGWQDSGAGHWQTLWEIRPGFERVAQSDWHWPRRGDWMARLEEVVLEDHRPCLLIAHSLGCHLVAAWAAHSSHVDRVLGALLVAPPDLERDMLPPNLFNWQPGMYRRLPWRSQLVASSTDPFATVAAAQAMATRWGSELIVLGDFGHLNADAGLDDWPQGLKQVDDMLAAARADAR